VHLVAVFFAHSCCATLLQAYLSSFHSFEYRTQSIPSNGARFRTVLSVYFPFQISKFFGTPSANMKFTASLAAAVLALTAPVLAAKATPAVAQGGAMDFSKPVVTPAPIAKRSAAAALKQPLTFNIINSYPGLQGVTISYQYGTYSNPALAGAAATTVASALVGNPTGGTFTSSTQVVAPFGWAGRMTIGKAGVAPDYRGTKIEGNNGFNGADPHADPDPDIDVSYVDGYSLPVTCSCGTTVVTGCNYELWDMGNACANIVGDAEHPICVNDPRNIHGPPTAFFAPCNASAYTYDYNDFGANFQGPCDNGHVTCCIGTTNCGVHPLQPKVKTSFGTTLPAKIAGATGTVSSASSNPKPTSASVPAVAPVPVSSSAKATSSSSATHSGVSATTLATSVKPSSLSAVPLAQGSSTKAASVSSVASVASAAPVVPAPVAPAAPAVPAPVSSAAAVAPAPAAPAAPVAPAPVSSAAPVVPAPVAPAAPAVPAPVSSAAPVVPAPAAPVSSTMSSSAAAAAAAAPGAATPPPVAAHVQATSTSTHAAAASAPAAAPAPAPPTSPEEKPWGVVVGPDGTLIEIQEYGPQKRAASPHPGFRGRRSVPHLHQRAHERLHLRRN